MGTRDTMDTTGIMDTEKGGLFISVPWLTWLLGVTMVEFRIGTMGTMCTRGTGDGGLYGYNRYHAYQGCRRGWFIWVQ